MSRRCEAGSDPHRPERAHWRPSEAGGRPHPSAQNLRKDQRERREEEEKEKIGKREVGVRQLIRHAQKKLILHIDYLCRVESNLQRCKKRGSQMFSNSKQSSRSNTAETKHCCVCFQLYSRIMLIIDTRL